MDPYAWSFPESLPPSTDLPNLRQLRPFLHHKYFTIDRKKPQNPPKFLQVCSKFLKDFERCLSLICAKWFPRLSFTAQAPCPCQDDSACKDHQVFRCTDNDCMHFINLGKKSLAFQRKMLLTFYRLDEALSSDVLWCGYKQVNTRSIRNKFSVEIKSNVSMNQAWPMEVPSSHAEESGPSWLRGAAKLLEAGYQGDDWRALAKLLGYKPPMIDQFESTLQPSRAMLKDWIDSAGGTKLATEMVITFLQDLGRHDVIEIIKESEGNWNSSFMKESCKIISHRWNGIASSVHFLPMGQSIWRDFAEKPAWLGRTYLLDGFRPNGWRRHSVQWDLQGDI